MYSIMKKNFDQHSKIGAAEIIEIDESSHDTFIKRIVLDSIKSLRLTQLYSTTQGSETLKLVRYLMHRESVQKFPKVEEI